MIFASTPRRPSSPGLRRKLEGRLRRVLFVWTGRGLHPWQYMWPTDVPPYCLECGERNLIYVGDRTAVWTPDEAHDSTCSVPRQRRIRERYLRRYGRRAWRARRA
jgi:hypothetical protein